jgi:hypothetical protein
MRERLNNWKWWVGLSGLALEGVAGFLRLKQGPTSASLILLLLGLALMIVWMTDRFGKARSENYELLPK